MILIVDNDQDIAEVLKEGLRMKEPAWNVLAVTSAEAARSASTGLKIDVLIADVCMPGEGARSWLLLSRK